MTLDDEDCLVIGPASSGGSTNKQWILTTSGLVVAQRDVSARIVVVCGAEGKPEVRLTRGRNSLADEKKKEKEGFLFHVMLEKNEVRREDED